MALQSEQAPATLLRNIRVIDPQSSYHNQIADILISEGNIQDIQPGGSIQSHSADLVDIDQAHVSPGWIDMQVHLCDPGFEYKETLAALGSAACFGGFTGVVCYPNTEPAIHNSQMIYSLLNRSAQLPIDLHLTGTISEGGAGKELAEMYDMAQAGAIAFTDGTHPLQSSGLLLRALQYVKGFDALLIRYPQDNSVAAGGQMNEGPQSTLLGMKGIPEMAESIALARDLQLLAYAPGRIHFQPITATESLRLIANAKEKQAGISVGTTAAHLAFEDTQLNSFDPDYKLIPPIRDENQRKALIEAVKSGLIDVISSGHQAQSIEEKNVQFELAEPGMLGLQTAFSLIYTHLVATEVLSLGETIERLSINPRKILGLPTVSIEIGQTANLSLFQPHENWTLGTQHMPSRAKNSPLIGQSLQGKVLGIYHKGALKLNP